MCQNNRPPRCHVLSGLLNTSSASAAERPSGTQLANTKLTRCCVAADTDCDVWLAHTQKRRQGPPTRRAALQRLQQLNLFLRPTLNSPHCGFMRHCGRSPLLLTVAPRGQFRAMDARAMIDDSESGIVDARNAMEDVETKCSYASVGNQRGPCGVQRDCFRPRIAAYCNVAGQSRRAEG